MDKEVYKISQNISKSKMTQDKRYKKLLNYISTTETKEFAETLIECCLVYEIECMYIIEKYSDFKNGKLKDSDFRKTLMACMI